MICVRRRPKHSTASRANSRRARRCATATPIRPRSATPAHGNAAAEKHARRIAKLRTVKRKLGQRLEHVNALLDNALIAARNDKVKHAAIAHVVQVAEGRPQTEADFVQLEAELRKHTHYALRRRDPRRIETKLDAKTSRRETDRMRNLNPYRRRVEVTEEWYGQPPPSDAEELGDPEALSEPDLDGDDDLDEPDDDELDDEDDVA